MWITRRSRIAARLTRKLATIAENMRNITQQNLAMQELLKNMQNPRGYLILLYAAQENVSFQGNYYNGEDEVQSQLAGYQQYHEEVLDEREVRVDISTNYVANQPHEVPFTFPPNYDPENATRRSVSVVDRLNPRPPRNKQVQQLLRLEIDGAKSLIRNAC